MLIDKINKPDKKFEWDVAFSLCNQDFKVADAICSNLNPSVKRFFYGQNQQELITKNGPEQFANIFKSKSRLVVIFCRREWSESFYTGLERNAIIDRLKDGYNFIFPILMEPDGIPPWYPETNIYVKAYEHSVKEIVKFIEFKISQMGVEILPLNYMEKLNSMQLKIDKLRNKKDFLFKDESNNFAIDLIESLKTSFNKAHNFLTNPNQLQQNIFKNSGGKQIFNTDFRQNIYGTIQVNQVTFRLEIAFLGNTTFRLCSQSYFVAILFSFDFNKTWTEPNFYRVNIDVDNYDLIGWSKELKIETTNSIYNEIYFPYDYYNSEFYDLDKELISSETLIDSSIKQMLNSIEKNDTAFA